MSLRLYDTATRTLRDFVPLAPGRVGIYVCGATVQSAPHIGHLRPAVAFDVLRRWLTASGHDVTLIRNVTDIDDKILAKSAEAGRPWWAHALAIEREFTAAYDALGVLPVTYEPRATGHVTQMIELIATLIERGHAYVSTPGNVWFDVASWAAYGELTNQGRDVADALAASHAASLTGENDDAGPVAEKRHPRDFALWKAARPGEPADAAWNTPWGRGRPGWHLECSAMAHAYLGETFDIHGGGLDLRFPHHENEQAQSRAAGWGFAQTWLHSAWITQSGAKMSKSLGNGLLASVVLATAPAPAIRLAIVSAQYRSMLEWTPETPPEATATWKRIAGFVARATDYLAASPSAAAEASDSGAVGLAELPPGFVAAMNDDLNVPAALAVVHETIARGNQAIDAAAAPEAEACLRQARAMLEVLGLDPLDPQWAEGGAASSGEGDALARLVEAELTARAAARAAKDWPASDVIRDRLLAAGIAVKDTPQGARWSLG
ncbi:MAG: cysteine--tRNA ligase [Promicromonosporaceae bacterium]|nr:cysteine--tRNA ligase [Promicromonosporaceae bacterium]